MDLLTFMRETGGADGRLKNLPPGGADLVQTFAEDLDRMFKRVSDAAGGPGDQFAEVIRKANPALSDVHISTELTNLSIAYLQDAANFAAGFSGPFPVRFQAGNYNEYDRGDMFRADVDDALRPPATPAAGGGFKITNSAQYNCKEYAWLKEVDHQLMAQQATGDPVDDALAYTVQILMLIREKLFDTTCMGTSIWSRDNPGVASGPTGNEFLQWNNSASTPRSDLTNGAVRIHSKTGKWPNVVVVQPFVLAQLLLNAEVVDAFKHTTAGATPSLNALAASLIPPVVPGSGAPQMRVAGAVHTTSAEGVSDTFDYVVGKKALLAHIAPNPGLRIPTAWINFSWAELLGANSFGFVTRDFEDVPRKVPHSVETSMAVDIKVVASALGELYDTAVA